MNDPKPFLSSNTIKFLLLAAFGIVLIALGLAYDSNEVQILGISTTSAAVAAAMNARTKATQPLKPIFTRRKRTK